jgi:hypothetical protein
MPYEKFDAWHAAHELALEVYRITDGWPKCELFGLTSQTRRAALSSPPTSRKGRRNEARRSSVATSTSRLGHRRNCRIYFASAKIGGSSATLAGRPSRRSGSARVSCSGASIGQSAAPRNSPDLNWYCHRPPLHRPPLHRPPLHRPPLHRPPLFRPHPGGQLIFRPPSRWKWR